MVGYIYLLGSTTFGWYKIGKSRTPEVRIKTLGILLPFKIEVIGLWRTEDFHLLEKRLHEKHFDQRINGEWFRFSKKEVERFLAMMAHFVKVDTFSAFKNLERDSPDGTAVKIKVKRVLDPEVHERLKQEAIAARKLIQKAKCPMCGQSKKISASEDARGLESTSQKTEQLIQ